MKNLIKEILNEKLKTNSLGVIVSKPDQILVISNNFCEV
jgi:hypothetical protein